MMEANDRADKLAAASVAIDGTRIRTVREAKRLTQLYVANVVGVTTDTISRWENNRYPSIKRENAQKLADALEVPLEDILRQEAPLPVEQTGAELPHHSPRRTKLLILFCLCALLLLLATVILTRTPTTAPTAVRWLPRYAAPGEVIPVQIKVTRLPSDPFGFILKEKLPDGMRLVSSAPPNSAAEPAGSSLKWLVPNGGSPVTISYSVRTPAPFVQGKDVKVKGEIVLHGGDTNRTEEVGGRNEVRIGPYHWADANGDGRIDDDEIMPAYYVCDEMKGLGLDWKIIEAIWTGKGYRWDPKTGYTVLK